MGIARPGRLRAYAAREEAAPDLFGRIEAIHDRAGLHGPRGVRERGIVPVENA